MEEHDESTMSWARASRYGRLPTIAIVILILLVVVLAAVLVAEGVRRHSATQGKTE